MIKTNYHTHTLYCDGKNTPEEVVHSAIEKGFSVLGFSGHSPLDGEEWTTKEEDIEKYREEILSLKEKYSGKIEILLGIEQDYFSKTPKEKYDFIIGSVHGVPVKDGLLYMDASPEIVKNGIEKHFCGDPMLLAEKYYELISDVVSKTGADIIGHLDLLTKFEDSDFIFDTEDKRYQNASFRAIEKLSQTGALFEVNTGAMARGYRTSPYPEKSLLSHIYECGADVILTSDCHDKSCLDYGFEAAAKLIRECGFKRLAYLSEGTVKFTSI
ncbi:MAG: histidinol-phosphatase [Ruminococcus sp.]